MSKRSAARGTAAASSIRLTLRTSNAVATRKARPPRHQHPQPRALLLVLRRKPCGKVGPNRRRYRFDPTHPQGSAKFKGGGLQSHQASSVQEFLMGGEGAKPGHEGHSRTLAQDPDRVIEHRPACCPDCGLVLPPDLPAETVSTHEHIELPPVRPVVEQHRRLAVTCPACQARVAAPRPAGAASTPFGARLHATAVYLKCFQALSYERLQRALSDLFGLTISQGGLMAMLRRAQAR